MVRAPWKLWLLITSAVITAAVLVEVIFFVRSMSNVLPAVTASSIHFNEQLERGEDEAIYANSDESFRMAWPKDQAFKFFDRLRTKRGRCEYVGPTQWQVNTNGAGTFVTVTYHQRCSNGEADEKLIWSITGKSVQLDSMDMGGLAVTD